MGLFDLFRSKPAPAPEPALDVVHDLTLDRMQPGYLVDFAMRTYQVHDRARVELGEGWTADEWDLRAADDRVRLLREPLRGGDVAWSALRSVPIGAIDGDVRHEILTRDDPPSQLFFQSAPYLMDRTGAGYLRRAAGTGPEEGFVFWAYTRADDPSRLLRIEQLSETDVLAWSGERAEEYQFTSLLPGAPPRR